MIFLKAILLWVVQISLAFLGLFLIPLEKTLIRPLRELLSTSTSNETKNAAQTKVDEIEAQIETLRSQFVSIGE
jgi:HAMP domain-containing protein